MDHAQRLTLNAASFFEKANTCRKIMNRNWSNRYRGQIGLLATELPVLERNKGNRKAMNLLNSQRLNRQTLPRPPFWIYICLFLTASSKIYDKRDDFDFDMVNFPFLDGDVPCRPSY